MRGVWIIYAIFAILVCLLLWRVATQWKVERAEAKNLRISVIVVGFVALALVVWQYGRPSIKAAFTAPSENQIITVFASGSTKNALDDVDSTFATRSRIKVSYGASLTLIKQIEGGASADAFISANLKWMDYGVEKEVVNESTRINLLGNALVLIAAKDSKIDHVDIERGFDLANLAGDGRIAVGDLKVEPVGLYAKAALEKLGVWRSVESKMAMTVDDRVALAYVARARRRSASFMRPMPRSKPV